MTREEAINLLEENKRQNEIMRDSPNMFFRSADVETGAKNAQARVDALNIALGALREQIEQEKNDPLTPDELLETSDEPVWAVNIEKGRGYWAFPRGCIDHKSGEYVGVWLSTAKPIEDYGEFGLYGKTWLAYRRKPDGELR